VDESNFSVCKFIEVFSDNKSTSFKEIGQLLCVEKFQPNQIACQEKCSAACEEYQYRTTVTSAPWPNSGIAENIYVEYFIGNDSRRFGNLFYKYGQFFYEYYNTENDSAYIDEKLKTEGVKLFQNNFLELHVQFNANKHTTQKDVATFPLDAFGAQVGGVLSLWLGVTIMLVFEVFDMVINLIYECHRCKYRQQSPAGEIIETQL